MSCHVTFPDMEVACIRSSIETPWPRLNARVRFISQPQDVQHEKLFEEKRSGSTFFATAPFRIRQAALKIVGMRQTRRNE